MGLKRALDSLPGDRDVCGAVHEVLAYLRDHIGSPVMTSRVARVTGLSEVRVAMVMTALAKGFVIDCDGDPALGPCTYEPDTVLSLEVERFLRCADSDASKLQQRVDRFRCRYGSGH